MAQCRSVSEPCIVLCERCMETDMEFYKDHVQPDVNKAIEVLLAYGYKIVPPPEQRI